MILQASSSRKESCVRFLAEARNEVELLIPIPVVIPNAVRNLKKVYLWFLAMDRASRARHSSFYAATTHQSDRAYADGCRN